MPAGAIILASTIAIAYLGGNPGRANDELEQADAALLREMGVPA